MNKIFRQTITIIILGLFGSLYAAQTRQEIKEQINALPQASPVKVPAITDKCMDSLPPEMRKQFDAEIAACKTHEAACQVAVRIEEYLKNEQQKSQEGRKKLKAGLDRIAHSKQVLEWYMKNKENKRIGALSNAASQKKLEAIVKHPENILHAFGILEAQICMFLKGSENISLSGFEFLNSAVDDVCLKPAEMKALGFDPALLVNDVAKKDVHDNKDDLTAELAKQVTMNSMDKVTKALQVLPIPVSFAFQTAMDNCKNSEEAAQITAQILLAYETHKIIVKKTKQVAHTGSSASAVNFTDAQRQIFEAIEKNDLSTVQDLLRTWNHDDFMGDCGYTPVMSAVRKGHLEIAQHCFKNCIMDLAKKDDMGNSLLALIVMSGNEKIFNCFMAYLDTGALSDPKDFAQVIDEKGFGGLTPLRIASELVTKLPKKYDFSSPSAVSDMHIGGSIHMFKELLKRGANYMTLADDNGVTVEKNTESLAQNANNPLGAKLLQALNEQKVKDKKKQEKAAKDLEKIIQDEDKKKNQHKLLAAKKAEKLKQEEQAEKERLKREEQQRAVEQAQVARLLKLAAKKKKQEQEEKEQKQKKAEQERVAQQEKEREEENSVIAKSWYEVRQKSAALKQWKDAYAARITFLTELEKKADNFIVGKRKRTAFEQWNFVTKQAQQEKKALAAQAQKIEEERAAKAELERLETERLEKEAQELACQESARLEQIAHELKLKKDAEQAHKKQQEELAAQAQIHTMAQPPIQYVQMPQPLQQVVQYVVPTAFIQQQMPHEALFNAVRAGDQAGVDFLVTQGIPVDIRDAGGKSALMLAAEKNNVALQNCLIAHRADVNASSRLNKTAAILAAQECNLETLRNLSAGNFHADFNVRDNSRKNVVDYLVGRFKDLHYHFAKKEEALDQQNKVMSQKDEVIRYKDEIIEKQRLEIEQLRNKNATE